MFDINLKFNPETLVMLSLAIVIDSVPIILIFFGIPDLGLMSMIGDAVIMPWMVLRNKKPKSGQSGKGLLSMIRGSFTGNITKFAIPIIGEAIPYVDILPLWTLSVLFNLIDTE